MGLVLILTISCKKKEEVPVIVTSDVSEITKTTATCGGRITSDGGAAITARGVCWSTGATPTTADSKTNDGTGTISFPSAITGLTAGTTYNVRAYATNSAGTAYGIAKSFTTLPLDVPVLTTTAVTAITSTSATSGGDITSDGGAAVTARGVCWGTAADPTIDDSKTTDGDGTGAFTSSITDLAAGTTYYVRAYATNAAGTGYGSSVSFLASALPDLTTSAISEITQTTATGGGEITSDGNLAITARGVCWSTGETPTIDDSKTIDGDGIGSFTSALTDLTANTTYNVRAYATNSEGTTYGNVVSFTTLEEGVITDFDGNIYHTVTIGTQVWLVEDLKTTHYNNGDPIPNVTSNSNWAALSTPGYCWYNNDEATYKTTYGAMYNWYAVNTGKLAPMGWHVPTDEEWTILTTFLGGEETVAGGKLKEIGTTLWRDPNTGATNESGFTAVPGGFRLPAGGFGDIALSVNWWSTTEYNANDSWHRAVSNAYEGVWKGNYDKNFGFYVRLVKDSPAK